MKPCLGTNQAGHFLTTTSEPDMSYESNLSFKLPRPHTPEEMDALSDAIDAVFPEDDPLVGIGNPEWVGVMVDFSDDLSALSATIAAVLKVLPEGSEFISADIKKEGADSPPTCDDLVRQLKGLSEMFEHALLLKSKDVVDKSVARIEALEAERDAAYTAGFEACREMARKATNLHIQWGQFSEVKSVCDEPLEDHDAYIPLSAIQGLQPQQKENRDG